MGPPIEDYLEAGAARGLKWTVLRLAVLDFLYRDRKPWGPYRISKEITRAGLLCYPNSIYRVLYEMEKVGLIVPVVSAKGAIITPDPHCGDWSVFICATCEAALLEPLDNIAETLRAIAREQRFATTRLVVECSGTCSGCASAQHPPKALRRSSR